MAVLQPWSRYLLQTLLFDGIWRYTWPKDIWSISTTEFQFSLLTPVSQTQQSAIVPINL